MPILESAKKQMRQSRKKRALKVPLRSELKTLMKKELGFIKAGKLEEAQKLLPIAYKTIDTAAKKYLIHKSNAARKKSLLARALTELVKGGKKVEAVKA